MSNHSDLPIDDIFGENPFGKRTVDDVVVELLDWFGIDAVQQAIKLNSKRRKGRPSLLDVEAIANIAEMDALEWLEGSEPFKSRSNYSIAKLMASKNPGQSFESTKRRIMRELAQNRKAWAFNLAMAFCLEKHPYTTLFLIEDAVAELDASSKPPTLGFIKEQRAKLNSYCELFGEPDPRMTWVEIGERLSKRDL